MKKALAWLSIAVLAIGFCVVFPPFHMVPLGEARQKHQAVAFDAAAFARNFWETKLLPQTERAIEAKLLLDALAQDPNAARERFGRSVGLSSARCFFVKGSGRISQIEKERTRILLNGSEPPTPIDLYTGFVFGNTVRDATGLLDVNDFANSQDFNAISTELNGIIEREVLLRLRRQGSIDKSLRFTGCVELEEGAQSLTVIPVKVEWP